MNILVVVKDLEGGTGTFALQLLKLNRICKNGETDVKILAFSKPKLRFIEAEDCERVSMGGSYNYNGKYSLSFNNVTVFSQNIFRVAKTVRENKIDIILGVDTYANIILTLLRLFHISKAKIILTLHSPIFLLLDEKASHLLGKILYAAIGYLYNKADTLVSVSKGLEEIMRNDFHLHAPILTIYNGVSIISSASEGHPQRKNILCVGRLTGQKNFELIINAFAQLVHDRNDCTLQIVGDGPLRRLLMSRVKKLQIEKYVQFLGWKNNLMPYYRRAFCFVLASKREGLPYVLLEAMSWGKPVIATDTLTGPRELLGDKKYGILIPMDDIQALVEALRLLITNKQIYSSYRRLGIERSRYFSEEKMLNSYHKLFLSLSGKEKS